MSHILGNYASNKILERGGNWLVYMNPTLAVGKGMTVVTSGTQVNSTTFTQGDVITDCYTDWSLIPNDARVIVVGYEKFDMYVDLRKNLIGDERAHIELNNSSTYPMQPTSGFASSRSQFGIQFSGIGQIQVNSAGFDQQKLLFVDCIVTCRILKVGTGNSAGVGFIDSVFNGIINTWRGSGNSLSKNSTNLGNTTFYLSQAGDDVINLLDTDVSSNIERKKVFTDYDTGYFTLNPDPQYASTASFRGGKDNEDSLGFTDYGIGVNPYIRDDGSVIGSYGIGAFLANLSIGNTVPTSPTTFADVVETLGSALTRNNNGVEVTASSGSVTVNNTVETPAMYCKSNQIWSVVLQKIISNDVEHSTTGYVSCEFRIGQTEAECRAATYYPLEINRDNAFLAIKGYFKGSYIQIKFTLTRYSGSDRVGIKSFVPAFANPLIKLSSFHIDVSRGLASNLSIASVTIKNEVGDTKDLTIESRSVTSDRVSYNVNNPVFDPAEIVDTGSDDANKSTGLNIKGTVNYNGQSKDISNFTVDIE